MVDRHRRLAASPRPALAKADDFKSGNQPPTVNMLVGFVAGTLTVMVVALLYCLLRRKVIPLGKQRRGLKGELKVQERNLETEILKPTFRFHSLVMALNDAGKEVNESLKYDKISLRRFDLEELEKATNNFSLDCLLGSGAFGTVYKGTFELEGTLAIKRAHRESFFSTEEFRNGQIR